MALKQTNQKRKCKQCKNHSLSSRGEIRERIMLNCGSSEAIREFEELDKTQFHYKCDNCGAEYIDDTILGVKK